jgi:hemerythrin-like metal-binding protein
LRSKYIGVNSALAGSARADMVKVSSLSEADQLRIHLEDIAVQHRRLAGLTAALLAAVQNSFPRHKVASAFDDFVGYLELHVSDEEDFMRVWKYPAAEFAEHCREHVRFLATVREYRSHLETGEELDPSVPGALHEALERHAAEHDERYLEFFRARAGI